MAPAFRPIRPTRATLDRYLSGVEDRPLSYRPIGMTAGDTPEPYETRRGSILLGSGDDVFARAAAALGEWRMFDIPWVLLYPDRPAIREDLTVVVAARTLGIWSLNPARVIAAWQRDGDVGFAYGTVEGHTAAGEERFRVIRDADGSVHYRITAMSRLATPPARAAGPVARRVQERFGAASLEAMRRAVDSGAPDHS
jgi:uncharacterized protein (UPF0548 family)